MDFTSHVEEVLSRQKFSVSFSLLLYFLLSAYCFRKFPFCIYTTKEGELVLIFPTMVSELGFFYTR